MREIKPAPKEEETSGNIKSYHGTPLISAEYNALMELEQLIHNPIPLVSEWNSNIFGFIAQENHVIALGIPSKELTTLPENICNLQNLTRLSFKNNLLSTLPDKFGNLTALIQLDLFRNNLNSLPEKIENLSALKWLYLKDNQLNSLPIKIKNALKHLERQGCKIVLNKMEI